jgi:predicted nucleic acid-binding protein
MIIVSDTSPINYLVLIGEIEVLQKLAGQVIIPQAVYHELQDPRTPQQVKDWIDSGPAWIEVRQANPSFYKPKKNLGAGEREAIALALELHADALLLDDRDGTKEARRHNIPTLSTFGILEEAAKKTLLDFPDAVDKLSRTSFYMPPDEIIQAALERDQERKDRG